LDEPFLAGYPEQASLAVRALNAVLEGVGGHWSLHVCYGNRYARPAWEGHYDFLFPAVMEARIDELMLEFARKGYDDVRLFPAFEPPFALGLGVLDVKRDQVEAPETVSTRIRRCLDVLRPEQVAVNPDCGLRHLAPAVARAKLVAMVDGAAVVRAELEST
jgi:5-methyltetrahydropteroyltriglutamate--homocysteine methyltransferase